MTELTIEQIEPKKKIQAERKERAAEREARINERLAQMTTEEKARLVCGDGSFHTTAIKRLQIPSVRVLDGGTGINYEQLIGDLILSWKEHPEDSEDGRLLQSLTHTEERNVIFRYFNPDRLTVRERKVWSMVRAYLKAQIIAHTTNPETTLAFVDMAGDAAADIMTPACFPCGMLLGATFHPDVMRQVGQALGREARAYGIHMLLGTPNINIHRDPLAGRLFEGFSEDPYLVTALAPELVNGVQAEGVAANIKHFAANNQEKNRQGIDETISERALHEIYLPGFAACVKKAHPATVMAAYNKINGVACTENKWLLTDVLRKEWGFDGLVVSDWGAVYHQEKALAAGCDLTMPGASAHPEELIAAVEAEQNRQETDTPETSGSVTAALEESAARMLSLGKRYASPARLDMSAQYVMDMSKQAAYRAACEGIVMLKNENGIFPLYSADRGGSDSAFAPVHAEEERQEIVLCGSGAVRLYDCGTGSAGITTDKTSSIYEGLIQNGVEVNVGIPVAGRRTHVTTYICVARIPGMEGNDRDHMRLLPEDARTLDQLLDIKRESPFVKLGLILNVSGPVDLTLWEPELDGIFCMFLAGMEGGHAMADILTGRVNPSGKLPLTFPKKYQDTPTYLNFPGDGDRVTYGEGIFVGYRYYDKKMVAPLFPFGHGLSYSRFEIGNERAVAEPVPVEVIYPDGRIENRRFPVVADTIRISVDVANYGPEEFSEGMEVVQLYISDPYATLTKPVKELKAFEKVRLSCGARQKVTFTLSRDAFASYDPNLHAWIAEEGVYNILIGNSSRNIVCSLPVYLDARTPYSYGLETSVKRLYENVVTRAHMEQLMNRLGIDWSHITDTYEYVPVTRLIDLIRTHCAQPEETALEEFRARVGALKRI